MYLNVKHVCWSAQIYVQKTIANMIYSQTEKDILTEIAQQSSFYGGEGTFMARAMLRLLIEDDFSLSRKKAPNFFVNKKPQSKFIKGILSPNPVNQSVNIRLTEKIDDEKSIFVRNTYGSIVLYLKWEKELPIFTINTEKLKSGVYYVSIHANDEIFQTDKMVVIH